jgi:uncharacterized membrane protein
VRYCRHVTEVWCGFFAVNAAISIWSAVAASREVLGDLQRLHRLSRDGTLLGGEWLLRRHLFPHAR